MTLSGVRQLDLARRSLAGAARVRLAEAASSAAAVRASPLVGGSAPGRANSSFILMSSHCGLPLPRRLHADQGEPALEPLAVQDELEPARLDRLGDGLRLGLSSIRLS